MEASIMFRDLILKNRTCRRFYENQPVSYETLKELVDLARLSPSASNLQPLKYILSCDPAKNNLIFPCLAWAGYLKEWGGPKEGERPSAYIVILCDTHVRLNAGCDHGIAAQSIMLGAVEKGLAGCMLSSVQKEKLAAALNVPVGMEIQLVLALGKPKEQIFLEDVKEDGDIKYYRDDKGGHHVPKRSLDEIILDL
jgi:nitroreductase